MRRKTVLAAAGVCGSDTENSVNSGRFFLPVAESRCILLWNKNSSQE